MGDANVNALNVGPGGVGVVMHAPAPLPPPAPCTLPPYEDVAFVGRVADLAKLDAWLQGPRRVLVLHGAPGVGKTRLAVEWAHRQAAAFPGGRYFLSFRADPHEALHGVARLRGLLQQPGERLDEWAIRTLHDLGAGHALVIFDDLQSPEEFAVWFSRLSTARAIVVTNERVWPTGYDRVPVEVLEPGDALNLARGVIGDGDAAERHAGNIVARTGRNAVQIVVDAAAVHEAVELGESPSLPPLPAAEALASFERAWSTATGDARAFVCALALYRAQGTPAARVAEVLAADGWDQARGRKAATEAVRRHLVARDAEALSMHPLLRTFARGKGAEVLSAAAREAHARAFVARARAFRTSPGDRAKYAEVAHDEFDLAAWDTWGAPLSPDDRSVVGEALMEAGQFSEARGWYERAAEETRQGDALGRVDHRSLGLSLHEVGRCLSEQGQFSEARGWYERAADEMRQGDVHGRVDHAALGWALYRAAICSSELSEVTKARSGYERAAAELRLGNVFGRVDAARLATCLDALASTLDQFGLPDEAHPHREEAARLRASLGKP